MEAIVSPDDENASEKVSITKEQYRYITNAIPIIESEINRLYVCNSRLKKLFGSKSINEILKQKRINVKQTGLYLKDVIGLIRGFGTFLETHKSYLNSIVYEVEKNNLTEEEVNINSVIEEIRTDVTSLPVKYPVMNAPGTFENN